MSQRRTGTIEKLAVVGLIGFILLILGLTYLRDALLTTSSGGGAWAMGLLFMIIGGALICTLIAAWNNPNHSIRSFLLRGMMAALLVVFSVVSGLLALQLSSAPLAALVVSPWALYFLCRWYDRIDRHSDKHR